MILELTVKLFGGFWNLKNLCNEHRNRYIRFVLRMIYFRHLNNEGSYIAYSSTFDGPAVFPHGIKGIFISCAARIGRNAIIFHQVTIGSNILPDSPGIGAPTIGDNVLIGAGAKIIGNVTVGNNCRIGANAVVVTDVPDNCVVVPGKPTVIRKDNPVNRFYSRSGGGWVYAEDGGRIHVDDPDLVEYLDRHMQ